jgi:hypothetical protein
MNEKLQWNLIREFPQLFQGISQPPTKSLMCYGISCGDGWYNILLKLCKDIMALEDLDSTIQFQQIKEKFGRLVVYTSGTDRRVHTLTATAYLESASTCERCGDTKTAEPRSGGWIKTLCDKCAGVA